MRANDLIWSSVVNHYLLDRPAPPSDLLYWFEDGARIPTAFLKGYNRDLLLNNRLKEPAGFEVAGVPIDLAAILTPMLVIALKTTMSPRGKRSIAVLATSELTSFWADQATMPA
jgi:polyhydroxyalkanoate synthase